MIPNDDGRYCNACAKTVIDFSVMTDEAIQQYFLTAGNQSVCGRFKNIQLERIRIQLPGYFFKKRIALWQKFLVIFLICFGSNFFSIDILLGDSKALNAQTTGNRSSVKKGKKVNFKIKKRKKKSSWLFHETIEVPLDFNNMLVGFTQMSPDSCPALPSLEPQPNINLTDRGEKNDSTTSISVAGGETPSNNKQPEKKQVPARSAEFILPAILRLRRRTSKKAR
jgi:hypothetical protein